MSKMRSRSTNLSVPKSKETPRVPKPRKNRQAADERHAALDRREAALRRREMEIGQALARVNEWLARAKIARLEDVQAGLQHRAALERLMTSKPAPRSPSRTQHERPL